MIATTRVVAIDGGIIVIGKCNVFIITKPIHSVAVVDTRLGKWTIGVRVQLKRHLTMRLTQIGSFCEFRFVF